MNRWREEFREPESAGRREGNLLKASMYSFYMAAFQVELAVLLWICLFKLYKTWLLILICFL